MLILEIKKTLTNLIRNEGIHQIIFQISGHISALTPNLWRLCSSKFDKGASCEQALTGIGQRIHRYQCSGVIWEET